MIKAGFCVGGPAAGQWREVHGNGFVVAKYHPGPSPTDIDYRPNATVDVQQIPYRGEVFYTPQGEILFWVPEQQTPLETLQLLVNAYEAAHVRNK